MSTDGSAVAERPTASSEPVLYQVSDAGVALITLNRPARRNAWGGALTSTFFRCIEDAEGDDRVRVIVLTGSGRAFCVGADMGDLNSISSTPVESAGETDGPHVGLRRGHRVELRAQLAGRDEAAALRRRRTADRRHEQAGRAADARIHDAFGFHRGHHRVLPEALTKISAAGSSQRRHLRNWQI